MKPYLRLILLTGFLTGAITMVAADAAITIAVRPAVTVARGNALLKVFIEPNDRNRVLTWEVDGPNYYRSSRLDLGGATAPRSWLFMMKNLPEGDYDIRATVTRNDRSSAVALSSIKVLPGAP
ncbi:MAG: hypothetical protein ND807_06130 [Vicinamibacterales bacterium]|nr:hypothetical protein [Vicinamibacterales bacterium]